MPLLFLFLFFVVVRSDVFAPSSCAPGCAEGSTCQFGICIDAAYMKSCNCSQDEGCIPSFHTQREGTCVLKPPHCDSDCGDSRYCAYRTSSFEQTTFRAPVCVDKFPICSEQCSSHEICLFGVCQTCAVCDSVGQDAIQLFWSSGVVASLFEGITTFDSSDVDYFPTSVKTGEMIQIAGPDSFALKNLSFTAQVNDRPAGVYIQTGTSVFVEVLRSTLPSAAVAVGDDSNILIQVLTIFNQGNQTQLSFATQTGDSAVLINELYLGPGATLNFDGVGYLGLGYVDAHPTARINIQGAATVGGEVASGLITLIGQEPSFGVFFDDALYLNASVTGPNGAYIEVGGTLEIDIDGGVITPDIYLYPNSTLILTDSSLLTGSVTMDEYSTLVLDLARGDVPPFLGFLASCPSTASIIFVVDEVFAKSQSGVMFTYNENTDASAFDCQVSLLDYDGDSLILVSSTGAEAATKSLLDCQNQAVWSLYELTYNTCDAPVIVTLPKSPSPDLPNLSLSSPNPSPAKNSAVSQLHASSLIALVLVLFVSTFLV